MVKNTVKQAEQAKPAKKERTVLTPEQRIAKLEAELKAARERAEAKLNKVKTEAAAKRVKLRDRMVALSVQHNELTDQVGDGAYATITITTAEADTENVA